MTERRKGIGGRRFRFNINEESDVVTPKTICTICNTNEVEEYPMMRGVCYDCYRGVVTEKVEVAQVDEPIAHSTWKSAMEQRDRNFNRRYYNNDEGKPEWSYNGITRPCQPATNRHQ